jgi:NTE family protein
MMPLLKNLFISLLLLLLPVLGSRAQVKAGKPERPKVALVLSGGGAKGFAHIGVLKVLEKEGIPIDIIVGTSMGSLIGGLYSIGYNASELETLVKSMHWETVLSDDVPRIYLSRYDQQLKQRYIFSLPLNGEKKLNLPQGLIYGQNVLNVFCGLAGNVPMDADFEKFPTKFACVATSLETGKEVVMKKGFLPSALYSSMAIPIAFQSSDRDGLLLVDGGLVNNFPTDVAKSMGADVIIGVDIRGELYDRKKLKSIDNILNQLVNLSDRGKDSINKSICNVMIKPDVSGYAVSSFNDRAVDTLIIRGEKATEALRQRISEIKSQYHLKPVKKSRQLVKPDKWHIADVKFTSVSDLDEAFLKKKLNIKIPGDYSCDDIKNAIDRIYGMGGYELIYYNLIDSEDGKILNLNIKTKKVFMQNVGFKANTTDAAAILLNTTLKNNDNLLGLLSASAELSINPGISLTAETNKTNFPTVGINLSGKYQNYNVFSKGEKIFKADNFYSSASLYLYQSFMKKFNLGVGLREEYYRGDVFMRNSDYPVTSGKIDHFFTNAYSYLCFDNMDDYYFPKKGTNMYGEFSMVGDFHSSGEISPALLLKVRNVIPIQRHTAFLFDLYGRALYGSSYPQSKMTLIGGEPYSQYFNYHLPFVGLEPVNIGERFVFIGLAGLRFEVAKSQYISLLFNGLRQTNDAHLKDNVNTIYGGGAKYSLKTFLGPLDVTVGYSGSTDRPTFSANFGYWF